MKIATQVRGANRDFIIDGARYSINYNPRSADELRDEWTYSLPNGETYSHPTQFGALLMIMKHLGGDKWEKFQ